MEHMNRPTNLSDLAYQKLKTLIIRGDIQQGEVVSIVYLSGLLQLGRTPTSIACQRLECDGLMRIIPKQGLLINPLTINDARDLYESRCAIEIFADRNSFDLLDDEDVQILEGLIAKQTDAGDRNDAYGFMELDTAWHLHILKKQPNLILASLLNNLTDRIFIFGIRNSFINQRLRNAIKEHQELINLIQDNNKSGFITHLEHHIMNGFFTLMGAYEFVDGRKWPIIMPVDNSNKSENNGH